MDFKIVNCWKVERVPEQENGFRFYFGVFNLLDDLRTSMEKYHGELIASEDLQQKYERYLQEMRRE